MIYRKRWSVERVFGRWKNREVLESHSFRALIGLGLFKLLCALADRYTRLVEAGHGREWRRHYKLHCRAHFFGSEQSR